MASPSSFGHVIASGPLVPKASPAVLLFQVFYLVVITEALCKELGVQLTAPVPVTQLLMLLHKPGKRKPSRETVLSYHIDGIIYTLTWQSNTLFEKYSSVWLSLSFWITVLNCTRIFKKKYAKKLSKKVRRITALVSLILVWK